MITQDIKDRFLTKLKSSDNILLVTQKNFSLDGVCTMLGLEQVIKNLSKNITLSIHDYSEPSQLKFLPESDKINDTLINLRNFIISLDISKTKVSSFSYDVDDDNKKLDIFVTPEKGSFDENDISSSLGKFIHDLIIVVDCPNQDSLGPIYQDNKEFFDQIDIINIDTNKENTNFGNLDIINSDLISTSEIIFDLFNTKDNNYLNEQVATILYTGIVSRTSNFQSSNVNAQVLKTAAELIKLGADKQRVVTSLYYTKDLPTLRLWGRVLARLKNKQGNKILWSILIPDDFSKTNANLNQLHGVIEEMLKYSSESKVVFLLIEDQANNQIKTLIYSPEYIDKFLSLEFLKLEKKVNSQAEFIIDLPTIHMAENQMVAAVERMVG